MEVKSLDNLPYKMHWAGRTSFWYKNTRLLDRWFMFCTKLNHCELKTFEVRALCCWQRQRDLYAALEVFTD